MDSLNTHQSEFTTQPNHHLSIFQQQNLPLWNTITNERYEEIFKQASLNLIKNQHFLEKNINNLFDKVLFQLISNYLFKIQNNIIMLCETNYCIFKKIIYTNQKNEESENLNGFRLIYLDQKYEFFAETNEIFLEWCDLLYKVTIQQNINLRYKIEKKIEKQQLNDYEISFYCTNIENKQVYYMQALEKEKLNQVATNKILIQMKLIRQFDIIGITKICEVYENQFFIFIIYELSQFLDIKQKADEINKMDEMSQSIIFYKLISTLNSIHQSNIILRNIRIDNLLLNANAINLVEPTFLHFYDAFEADSNIENLDLPNYFFGYVPPEVISNRTWSQQSDIYSLGIVFYSIVFGKNPFLQKKEEDTILKNEKGEIDFSTDKLQRKITLSQLDLIKSMLRKDPQQRITLHNALNHHWFVSNKTKHGGQPGSGYYDKKLSTIQEFSERIEKQSSSHFTSHRNNSLHFTHASLNTGKKLQMRSLSISLTINTNQDEIEEDMVIDSINYFKRFVLRPSKFRHDLLTKKI